jgi:hypothetical protein
MEKTGKAINIIGYGWLMGWGLTADKPADNSPGWAPGAQWTDIQTGKPYINQGTSLLCDFDEVTGIA